MGAKEQKYKFIDKSGHCFEDFQRSGEDEHEQKYRDCVGAFMRGGKEFGVGDMLVFRDDLINAGFRWGTDFYIVKI